MVVVLFKLIIFYSMILTVFMPRFIICRYASADFIRLRSIPDILQNRFRRYSLKSQEGRYPRKTAERLRFCHSAGGQDKRP
ncbi:MAG: hypothetical protein BWK80_18080 [Desulfobacteraceae bacterium IS3]|nr:MAG: hypothetical protein BWK80_18080 [Desulfobacteraceae bacterium IS3]HAO20416.1 hypothetical protein [Desulfobacteraceae bacterium]